MFNLKYIRACLGDSLISEKLFPADFEKNREIELLDSQRALQSDLIYIGTQKQVRDVLASNPDVEPSALVITAEAAEPLPDELTSGFKISFIETSLSLAECYNLINGIMRRQRRWQRELQGMKSSPSTQMIMEYLSEESGASVFLIDPEGFVVAGCNKLSSRIPVFRSLVGEGRLSAGQLSSLKSDSELHDGYGRISFPNYDLTVYSRTIPIKESYVMLIFIYERPVMPFDLRSLTNYSEEPLALSLLALGSRDLSEEDRRFKQLWNDILDKRFNNSSEIRDELIKYPTKPLAFSRVILIGFEKPTSRTAEIIAELHKIFPISHIAAEESEMVVVLYHPKRLFSLELENDLRLKAFLEKYDAYLSYSGATREYIKLGSQYRLARQILTLGRQLELEPNERIFTHEKYSVYCIIELCAQRYCSVYGNNDIILLNHPAIIHLTRYDRDHNNNLRDVLYVYLMNDCSISKTAAKTFMHRNTIFNKLKKIEELIDINFEDGAIRQQLLFSCQLILYYERVMGLRLNLDGGKNA